VLINLLSNAIKFAPKETGVVSVFSYINSNKVEIFVEDNGKGIDPNDLISIFNKFYQSKNQTILKPVGSGLGLAISKHIIESHKGKIWAQNIKPTGARLTFILPLN
jgi:signal transduction histidine kinase